MNDLVTQQARREVAPIDSLKSVIVRKADDFKMVLPSHISFDKFQRTIATAALTNPKLLECDKQSLLIAAMKLATDGLLPDGREAALVPFKTRVNVNGNWRDAWIVQAMPMAFGLRKKVLQSGEVISLELGVVYEDEVDKNFIYEIGLDPPIRHRPNLLVDPVHRTDDKIVAAYSIAKIKNGDQPPVWSVEVMARFELNKVRQMSQTGAVGRTDRQGNAIPPKGPWVDWYSEMCKKSVLRRHTKVLPMSGDLLDTFDRDDAEERRAEGMATMLDNGGTPALPSNESFAGEDGGAIAGGDNQQSQNATPSPSDILIDRFNSADDLDALRAVHGDWQESGLARGDNEDIENAFEAACKRLDVDPKTGEAIAGTNGSDVTQESLAAKSAAQHEEERVARRRAEEAERVARRRAEEAELAKAQAETAEQAKVNKVRQDAKAAEEAQAKREAEEAEAAARQLDEQQEADPRADAVATYQGFKSEMEGATNAAQRAAVHEGYAQWISEIEHVFPDIHEWAMELLPVTNGNQPEEAAETAASTDTPAASADDNPQEAGIRKVITDAKNGIAAAKTLTYLNAVMKEVDKHFAVLPESDVEEIDRLAAAKRRELAAKK